MDRITSIQKRQTARLLDHLERKQNLTDELRADILRSFRYTFEDITSAIIDAQNTKHEEGAK